MRVLETWPGLMVECPIAKNPYLRDSYMVNLLALIFDVDGTLADTETAHLEAFNAAFVRAGLDWQWSVELYRELLEVTGGKERIRHYLDRQRPEFAPPSGETLDEFIAGLHREKTRVYVDRLAHGAITLRPGVERLIREAREAGLTLAIATTTTPANVTALLENTLGSDALAWFQVIGAGGIVPAKKPAPDIYRHVLEELGMAPEECLALEDSGPGLAAAMAAGVVTVVAVNDFTRDHDFTGAALVLDSFGEPDRPFQVLAGDPVGRTCLDLELLRQVHARAGG